MSAQLDTRAAGDPLAPHSLSPSELKDVLAAERRGGPFLIFRDHDGRLGLFVPPRAGAAATIGRRVEMDLSISWDREVSGLHAELQRLGAEWTIADDGLSTNGTYVNGQRITGRQRLRDGDRIRVGRTLLVYNAATVSAPAATVCSEQWLVPQLTDTQRRVLLALCRPYRTGGFATPATNSQIAAEMCLSVDAVKMHLRSLFAKFELSDLPQNQKRARLVECALQFGAISPRELS